MKLNRFWVIQIVIAAALFTLLIGSYLLSFNILSTQTNSNPIPVSAETVEDSTSPAITLTACVPAGSESAPDWIESSLTNSDDPVRQQSCLAFLQTENQAGDHGAALWLGRAYHNGWGVDKDTTQAAAYYRKAAGSDTPDIRESAEQWLLLLEKGDTL